MSPTHCLTTVALPFRQHHLPFPPQQNRIRSKLKLVLKIHTLMSNRKRAPFISLQLVSRWRNILELYITVTSFLNKYPHVFDVFTHPFRRNTCCRITRKMRELIMVEEVVIRQHEIEIVADCICEGKSAAKFLPFLNPPEMSRNPLEMFWRKKFAEKCKNPPQMFRRILIRRKVLPEICTYSCSERVKKLLMMSVNGTFHVHALKLI